MHNRTVLITGTSRGLGRDLAEHYARAENTVIGISRGGSDLKHAGYTDFRCDISNPADLAKTLATVTARFPKIDILVNSAAVLKSLPLVLMSEDDIQAMIGTNFLGTVLCSKALFRQMIKNGRGRIVNITSMSDQVLVPGDAVYAATKSAVDTFARILNREGVRFGVRVNNLAVSAYATGMLSQIIDGAPEKVLRHIPHGALTTLSEVVRALDFLADLDGHDIGGQTLYLGGV